MTQAYPPDYEDADDYTAQTRTPRSAMRYQQALPNRCRGQVVCRLPRSACAASVSPGMLPVNSNVRPHDAGSTGPCTW